MEATGCHGALAAKKEAAAFPIYFEGHEQQSAPFFGGAWRKKNEPAVFHIDLEASDTHYDSFFGGEDISFGNPDAVSFAITGVTKAGDNVTFTWTATKNGSAVNPCNDNLALGPTFRCLGAYLAYAKGDDWVNENVGSSPGQPASARNLFTSLSTTCADNVATTTGLVVDPDA